MNFLPHILDFGTRPLPYRGGVFFPGAYPIKPKTTLAFRFRRKKLTQSYMVSKVVTHTERDEAGLQRDSKFRVYPDGRRELISYKVSEYTKAPGLSFDEVEDTASRVAAVSDYWHAAPRVQYDQAPWKRTIHFAHGRGMGKSEDFYNQYMGVPFDPPNRVFSDEDIELLRKAQDCFTSDKAKEELASAAAAVREVTHNLASLAGMSEPDTADRVTAFIERTLFGIRSPFEVFVSGDRFDVRYYPLNNRGGDGREVSDSCLQSRVSERLSLLSLLECELNPRQKARLRDIYVHKAGQGETL